ncbi:MAG: hypothetical protein CENE_02059 [Candidatus Celerinatantimonas neptuna]|nr:MAG: hypothetical protein CENE_02059 [Candidatus Celerinatantimonas neptuna]
MDQLSTLVFPSQWLFDSAVASVLTLLIIWFYLRRSSELAPQAFVQHSVSSMLIVSHKDHRILFANPYAAELLSLSRCRGCWQLLTPHALQKLMDIIIQSDDPSQGLHWFLEQGNERRAIRVYACSGRYLGRKVWYISAYDDHRQHSYVYHQQQQVQRLFDAFNSLPNFVYFKDRQNRLLGCNEAWANFHGLTPMGIIGKSMDDILTRRELQREDQMTSQVLEGNSQQTQEWVIMGDGKRHLLETHSYPLLDSHQQSLGVMSISTDVTNWHQLNQKLEQENQQRLLTEQQLEKQNNLIRSVFNASPDPIGFFDEGGSFTGGNEPFAAMFGLSQTDLLARNVRDVLPAWEVIEHIRQNNEIIKNGKMISYEELVVLPDERQVWYEIRKAPYFDHSSHERGVILVARDVTERKKTEQQLADAIMQLEELSFVDGLTQIANRRSFDERLSQLWLLQEREQRELSLILLDIDCFKQYNDNYGHQQGDEALRKVASIIKETVKRGCDLVARYGGEEFAVLMPNTDLDGACSLASQLLENIALEQIEHGYSEVTGHLTISIGVSSAIPHSQRDYGELIEAADICLYHAKRKGRNCYQSCLMRDIEALPAFSG